MLRSRSAKVYYGLILARKNIEAVEESIKTMQAHSNDAAKSYRVGLLTKSDKLSTDVRLAELQEQKLLLHDEIKNATDMLIVMLKLDPDVTIVPTGDLVVDRVLPAGAEKNIPENRADLKALETYRQVAAYQEEMARGLKASPVECLYADEPSQQQYFRWWFKLGAWNELCSGIFTTEWHQLAVSRKPKHRRVKRCITMKRQKATVWLR